MKKLTYFFVLLVFPISLLAQASFSEFELSYGTHDVGFKHIQLLDSLRAYDYKMEYNKQRSFRPISVSLWYPAQVNKGDQQMSMLDYMRIFTTEKEWAYLPDEELLNWYQYPNTEKNKLSIKESTKSFREVDFVNDKFPLILYAPSYEASSIENFALAEYLASHGYIVVSCPSLGPNNQWIGKDLLGGLKAQTRDLEFLLNKFSRMPQVDATKIATAGFSFGGLSNVLFQSRNQQIKAILSLDGTIRYNYKLLKEVPEFSVNQVDVPFLHMAQKAIPDEIMKKDKMDPKLNTEFQFYDELINSDAYQLRLHDLTHLNFSSLDIVFRNRDKRQDKSDEKILQSYRLVLEYSLQFLNAYLKDDAKALTYLQNKNHPNLISKEMKKGKQPLYTFEEFHDQMKEQQYQDIEKLYAQVKKAHPSFSIQEGWLNELGLQLIFNPKKAKAGVAVYNFALSLFPTSANLYDSLATGYFYLGEKELAIKNFKKSLELYPQNQNAISKLKELGNN